MPKNDPSSNETSPTLDRRTVLSMGVGGAAGLLGMQVLPDPVAAWNRFDVDFRGLDEVWFVVGNDLQYDPPAVAHVIVLKGGDVTCQLVEFTEANATTVPDTYGDAPVVKFKAESGRIGGVLAYNRAVDSNDRFSRPRCVMQNDNLWINDWTLQKADCVKAAMNNHWNGEYRTAWWDPLKPDEEPTTPEAVLNADQPEAGQQFGASLAVDALGDTLVVGAPGDGVTGAVYVFEREGQWIQKATFTPNDADLSFGHAIDITATGETIVVGAPPQDSNTNPGGSVYVYTTDGDDYTLSKQLTGGGNDPRTAFGRSVAIDGLGDTLLVGTPRPDGGRGYVFESDPWQLRGELLIPDDGNSSEQDPRARGWGRRVELSAEGSTALLCDPGSSYGFGESHVFTRDNSTWTHQRLVGIGAEDHHSGHSLALNGTGDIALLGTDYNIDHGRYKAGYITVAKETQAPWSAVEKTTIVPQNGDPIDRFGRAVAIDEMGQTILVGSPYRDTADGTDAGVAYLFDNDADGVAYRSMIVTDGEDDAHFGEAVGLDAIGTLAVIGAPGATVDGVRAGTVSVFEIEQQITMAMARRRYRWAHRP